MGGCFRISIETNEVLIRYLERGFFKETVCTVKKKKKKDAHQHFFGGDCVFFWCVSSVVLMNYSCEDAEHEGK